MNPGGKVALGNLVERLLRRVEAFIAATRRESISILIPVELLQV